MKGSESLNDADHFNAHCGSNDPFADSSRVVDRLGSMLVGGILLAGLLLISITAPVVVPAHAYFKFMFSEVGDAATPWFTSTCAALQRYHLLEAIGLILAAYGYWLLRSIPDRRRANLHAGIVSLVLLAFGILTLFSSLILLMKQFSVIGFYAD